METSKMDMGLQKRIIDLLRDHSAASGSLALCAKHIGEKLSVEKAFIEKALEALQTLGAIERVGSDEFKINAKKEESIPFIEELSQLDRNSQTIISYAVKQKGPVQAKDVAIHTEIPIGKVGLILGDLTEKKIFSRGSAREGSWSYQIRPAVASVIPVEQEKPETPSKEVKVKKKSMKSIEKDILKMLASSKPLEALEMARQMSIDVKRVSTACYRLKKKGKIEAVGKTPYHYVLKGKNKSIERKDSDKSIPERVLELLSTDKDKYFYATEIVAGVGIARAPVSTALFALKKRKLVLFKKEGRKFLYKFKGKKTEITKPAPVKDESINKLIDEINESPDVIATPEIFGDYVIMYALRKADDAKKVSLRFLHHFKDPADFQAQFETLQKRSDLVEIKAFSKMELEKKVIFVPKVK